MYCGSIQERSHKFCNEECTYNLSVSAEYKTQFITNSCAMAIARFTSQMLKLHLGMVWKKFFSGAANTSKQRSPTSRYCRFSRQSEKQVSLFRKARQGCCAERGYFRILDSRRPCGAANRTAGCTRWWGKEKQLQSLEPSFILETFAWIINFLPFNRVAHRSIITYYFPQRCGQIVPTSTL